MYRSEHILKGLSNQYYRATYKSMGFTTEDLKRPIIGIANAWSECVPGHYNLRQVAQRVKDGIYRAGGTPIEFGVIGGCDGMGQGHDGMHFIMPSRELIAITLATWLLTTVGVFGDVACITVAPIALQMARRAGYHKMGVLMAQLGAVRAGNVMSPNPNAIAAAEAFNLPLTSIIAVGVIPAVTALIVTSLLAKRLSMRGTEITEADIGGEAAQHKDLPPLWAALSGPVVTIAILLLRPIAGITIDPLIALPVGGIVGAIAMGKTRDMGHYFNAGLAKMSGVAMLLVGTGALSGIISNSGLKDVIISFIETLGLPGFMLAPISGMLMGAATASATAGTTLASQIFGPTVVASGVTPLAAAAMTHASCFVFDGLPHGSFFHVSAGGVNMEISERLKLLGYEAINGLAMMAVSTLVFGVLKLAG